MNIRQLVAGAAATVTVAAGSALFLSAAGPAAAAPTCGGNQTAVAAPVYCTRTKTLFGSTWTATVAIGADGAGYVRIDLAAPRSSSSPVRATWHDGISSGPTAYRVSGTLPAGATTITLPVAKTQFMSPDCGGQLDVKVIEVLGSQSAGRLTAPYITTGRCVAPTTTSVPPTTVRPSAPATTAPPSLVPPTAVTAPTTQPHTPGTLPATGSDERAPLAGAALAVTLGVSLVLVTRRRPA